MYKKNIIGLLVFLFVFFIDRITKDHVLNHINDFYSFLGGVLKIHYVENTGIAFGMLGGFNKFFIIFNSFLLLFLFYFKRKINSLLQVVAIHMIIGGAVGNIFDRIKYGFVIDFIDLKYFPAVFNMGDFFITMGAIILFLSSGEEKC
jgi:signal peptidase II